MRGALWTAGTAFSLLAALGCGGATDSPLFDAGTTDSGGSFSDGGNPEASSCDTAKCPTIPDGFSLVKIAMEGSCPAGWSSTEAVTKPTAPDGACTCACDPQAECGSGNIERSLDYDPTTASCDTPASTFVVSQGTCSPTGLYLQGAHYTVNPVAAQGACTYDTKLDDTKISATALRVCTPPQKCVGAACDGSACIEHDDDVDCPAPFSVKALVGKSATATCSDCSTAACTLSATCGGTLSFFTDQACSQGEVDFPADGTCDPTPTTVTDAPYYSYSYTGTVTSATCSGTPPASTATPSLTETKTICCQ